MSGDSGDAKLIYLKLVAGAITEIEVDVYVKEVDIYGQEFYSSYQKGISVNNAFEVNCYDFEETKHIDVNTQKSLYATNLLYNGAKYDIVRHQSIKNSDRILLICS
ncbi:MAG: hypothetical protein K0R92_524 [Lachnospiraceae bacterium]|jgi:hypothetical protein|nr:hypothetical protein [Lachnospiraceae bacterium]